MEGVQQHQMKPEGKGRAGCEIACQPGRPQCGSVSVAFLTKADFAWIPKLKET